MMQEALLGENETVPGALDAIQLHHAANMPQPFLFVAVLTTTSTLARRYVSFRPLFVHCTWPICHISPIRVLTQLAQGVPPAR